MSFIFGRKLNNCLPRNSLPYGLTSCVNFAEDLENRKLIIGYYFFLNRAIVSWKRKKKQRTVSTSTIEVEYIAFKHVARKTIWIRQFINKIELEILKDITLYGNNEISITLTKNAKNQYQTKHINIQHH